MSKLSEPFVPDNEKTSAEQLNDVLNHMREQLDFLCYSAELQNEILEGLYNNSDNGGNQSKQTDN